MSAEDRNGRFGILDSIGSRICAIRKKRGMTQSQLAGEDVTRNMLSRIENGAALPSLPTLCVIADRLSVPVGALLGDLEEFSAWQLSLDMKRLLEQKKYDRVIEQLKGAASDEELTALLCKAYIGKADELYSRGGLGFALQYLEAADRICKNSEDSERIFILRTLISICPALYPDDAVSADSSHESRLRGIIFDKSGRAMYLYALTRLGGLEKSAYSQPHPMADTLRSELSPLTSISSDRICRIHIDAKLDMISAEYLDAKAKLLTILSPEPPPAILYDILADLEFCCKCCGDFENAYKYSGQRLELTKRIT